MTGGTTNQLGLDKNRRVFAVALALALVITTFLSILVTVPRPAAAASAPYRVLRIGVTGLPVHNLNPNTMTLSFEFTIIYNVYSTLLTYDANYNMKGDLAYSWSLAPDNVTWTFNLVHNAYFADPTNPTSQSHPVTADDVVFTYNANINTTASIWNPYVSSIAKVWKVDTYTVRMQTNGPYAGVLTAALDVPILPAYLWQGLKSIVGNPPSPNPLGSAALYYDVANSSITTGPIVLKRNPNFYGDLYYCAFSRPNEVRFLFESTPTTMVQDFLGGGSKLDALWGLDAASYVKMPPTNGVIQWAVDEGFVAEININVITPQIRAAYSQYHSGRNNPLLLNDTVRTAIAMSVNKSALVKYNLLGLGKVADTLVPDVNKWHYSIPPSEQYQFNPQAARALLNSQGWAFDSAGNPATSTTTPLYQKGGTNGLVFRLYTGDWRPEWTAMVANLTIWLGKAGIQTTDDKGSYTPGYAVKSSTFMDLAWKSADYDLWLWDWVFSPGSDPSLDVLQVETTSAIPALSDNYYSNSTYDSLYNQSLVPVSEAARRQITDTMQKMIYDYHSYILPYYGFDLFAATTRSDLGSGWQNWGNWSQSPGLTPEMSLPNLYYQIYPSDNPPPSIASFPTVNYYNGTPTLVNVLASDPDGEPLSFAWDFGDGTTATTTTNTVSHTWAQPGTYAVKVRVMDSEWPVCASTTAVIQSSTGVGNLPPQGVLSYVLPVTGGVSHAWVNQSIMFNFTTSDPNGDEVNVTWDFGDNTPKATDHVTGTSGAGNTVSRSHTYAKPGNYTLTLSFTDNKTGIGNHTIVKAYTIAVWALPSSPAPPPPTQMNPLVNYGIPLLIVAVVIIVVVATLLRRRGKMKEEEKPSGGEEPPSPPQA